ncbi:hypothetical protein M0812_09525 [Anaeramoeba flamelloides]|uniref:Uncharacterized protein n=1 Tax=Anaeramoeba flamelloides TaxID=1746091 RepID=A0AAV7ZS45_9EUKA|nr:hypothetical protein M0812_09525 [Anaeramoeba flamelloides]
MTATNMELFIRKSLEYYEIPFKKITALVSDGAPLENKQEEKEDGYKKNGKLISLPCLTRWGTWLQTCIEVLHNKDKLKQFIQLEERSKTSNILIEHLSSKIFLEELVFYRIHCFFYSTTDTRVTSALHL